jgi:hypothetical protein
VAAILRAIAEAAARYRRCAPVIPAEFRRWPAREVTVTGSADAGTAQVPADPLDVAQALGLGEPVGYYPFKAGRHLALAVGLTLLFAALSVGVILVWVHGVDVGAMGVVLTIFTVLGTLISTAGIVRTLRNWNRAVYLFAGGFVTFTRPGEPVEAFAWPDIILVRKRIAEKVVNGWRNYTETERTLEGGRVVERRSAPGSAIPSLLRSCSYHVVRSDGVTAGLLPEYRNVYALGEAVLRQAPVAPPPGPSA